MAALREGASGIEARVVVRSEQGRGECADESRALRIAERFHPSYQRPTALAHGPVLAPGPAQSSRSIPVQVSLK
eukprot:3277135-Rhodomonas_salina.1